MKSFFSLFGSKRSKSRSTSRRRPQTARPAVESLEDRMVPAASVNVLQAVAVNGGSAVFFQNPNGNFSQKTVNGNTITLDRGVTAFSAGVDRFGNADVFTRFQNNGMLEFNSQGVQDIKPPVAMSEFAAVHGDRLYAVATNGSLWQFNPFGGWVNILSAGQARYVDAVTQSSGADAFFVVRSNGQLQESVNGGIFHGLPGSDFTPGANFFNVNTISAGLDMNGNADVFALSTGATFGELWRWTNNSQGWTELGAQNQFISISATNNGQVFCLTFGGALDQFDAQNNLHNLGTSAVSEIAAASSNDVYFTRFDGSLWERTNVLFGFSITREWEGPNSAL
jgi:hypothetical protein